MAPRAISIPSHGLEVLAKEKPDLVLAFFKGPGVDEEELGVYNVFKSLTVGRGLAGQVVYDSTLGKAYALGNIVLAVLSKVGNIPFVLADPMPYADLVVGIDIARQRKTRL